MEIRQTLSIICLGFTLTGCVVPVLDKAEATASTCKTTTQSMALQMVDKKYLMLPYCNDEVCLAAALAVFAGSAIVSGSIVVINNTAHWLEYQGTCSDSYLNQVKQSFFDSLGNTTTPTPPN